MLRNAPALHRKNPDRYLVDSISRNTQIVQTDKSDRMLDDDTNHTQTHDSNTRDGTAVSRARSNDVSGCRNNQLGSATRNSAALGADSGQQKALRTALGAPTIPNGVSNGECRVKTLPFDRQLKSLVGPSTMQRGRIMTWVRSVGMVTPDSDRVKGCSLTCLWASSRKPSRVPSV